MIELGGFWAFYSLWFCSLGRDRRCIVIEPDPKHLETGRVNAELNGLDVTFVQGFAGETSTSEVPFKTEESGEISVSRYSVPDLMVAHVRQGLVSARKAQPNRPLRLRKQLIESQRKSRAARPHFGANLAPLNGRPRRGS
jgi:hypothetical protein